MRNIYQILEDETTDVEEGDEVERDFKVMEKTYTEVAKAVIGRPRKKKKPWISGESWNLVDQREEINKKILSTKSERIRNQLRLKYAEKDREVKRSVKADKEKWLESIASNAEEAARSQKMKTLYELKKKICNQERPRQSTAVIDKNGIIVNGKDEVQARWTEHFKEIINREEPTNPITDEEECIVDGIIDEITTSEPTPDEVRTAIKKITKWEITRN